LFSAAAGMTIGAADTTGTESAVAVVLFALAGSVSVAVPFVAHLVMGERANAPLRRANAWLTDNNATVMAVVLLVIGALVLVKGLGGL
jgi:Sap, sulfolipid-1-addressing protein